MANTALTLDYLAPYIEGKEFFGMARIKERLTKSALEDFLTLLEEDDIAKSTFDNVEIAAEFYEICTDFKHFIPKEQRVEAFYAAKLGGEVFAEIPAFCQYTLKKCYEQCYGLPNLIFKVMPIPAIKEFLTEGYFSAGYTMRDAICNVCNPQYSPVSVAHPRCEHDNFVEFYVQSTDMVMAVPKTIANALTDDCCTKIEDTPNGLAVNGVLIRTMCDYIGAINSKYDLRELL